ncbi:MAG: helix-turn-helix domain-containing protein [Solirubrobacterales bacterium]
MSSLPEHLQSAAVGRERLPREVVAEYQRDRILSAATAVFAERGYPATTIDQIVAAAHVGVGSFYEHFQNKEDCFIAAYEGVVASVRAEILAAASDREPWSEQLVAGLRALLEAIEADPAAARLALVEVHAAGEAALAQHSRNLDEVAELLRARRTQGGVSVDLPQSLEFATAGGLSWYLQERIAAGGAAKATNLLPELLEIVAEPYLVA